MRRLSLFILLLSYYLPNAMAEDATPAIVPEPPELPEQIVSGENMKPDITIIRKQKETLTEYSVNGQVYMVKITPKSGPAYYLIDTDGDGNLEERHYALEDGMNVPQWLLHSW
jgi:hypothetical protein